MIGSVGETSASSKPGPRLDSTRLRGVRGNSHPYRDTFYCSARACNWQILLQSLFALVIKNSPGRRRDFRVKMWGTSSPDDKLTGDLGNVIGATSIGGRRSDFFTARKLAPGSLRLLQQYRHKASEAKASNLRQLSGEQRKCMDGRPRLPSTRMPSRPGELHPEPLTDPDLTLSRLASIDRCCWQAPRTLAGGCARSPPIGDFGRCRQSYGHERGG
jgi:hypothetical protein